MPHPTKSASAASGATLARSTTEGHDEGLEQGKPSRTGYHYVPRISKDAGDYVAWSAIARVAQGKRPYAVIVHTEAEKRVLREAITASRTTGAPGAYARAVKDDGAGLTEVLSRQSGKTLESALRAVAAHRAARQALEIRSVEVDHALACLDPTTTKLYVFGHGRSGGGGPGLGYPMPDESLQVLAPEPFADEMKRRGLPLEYQDLRLSMCDGSTVPKDPTRDTESTAFRVAQAMGKAGFNSVTVSAYPGGVRRRPVLFEDRQLHRSVRVGSGATAVQKRASSARQQFVPEAVLPGPAPDRGPPRNPLADRRESSETPASGAERGVFRRWST